MVFQALQRVFTKPSYALLAIIVGVATFAMAVWMPNLGLLAAVVADPSISLSHKLSLPLGLLGSIGTNFTVLAASYTIAIAILFGVNVSMMLYYVKRRVSGVGHDGIATGIFGMASGIFGVGCAACGSFLLTSILTTVGAASALALLPLRGGEFGILGVALLAFSTYAVAARITNPTVCKI